MNSADAEFQPLLLVRHGPIAGEAGRCWGWTDLPLDPEPEFVRGLAQMTLPPDSLIVSSDLERARHTARLLAQRNPGAKLGEPASDLREMNFGRWEGLLWSEIETRDPELYENYMAQWRTTPAPEGESWAQLKTRCQTWLDRAPRDPAALVVIAHHGSLRALWALLRYQAGFGMGPASHEEQLDREAMGRRWRYGEATTAWRRRLREEPTP